MNVPERLGFLAERLDAARDIERAGRAQDAARVAELIDEIERIRVEIVATVPPKSSAP
jgi:hypothetical protein